MVCASFFHAAYPGDVDGDDYQLRFMATDPVVQGRGYGAQVLAEAQRRLRDRGVTRVWAYARDTALGFYQSVGWTAVAGSEFLSVETELPHTMIYKTLS